MTYTQQTLSSLLLQLETKWENSAFWTAEEGRLALNESFRVWNTLTGVWKDTIEVFTPSPPSPWISVPFPLSYNVRLQWQDSNSSYTLRIDEFARVGSAGLSASDRTRFTCVGFSIPVGAAGGTPLSRSSMSDLDNGRPGWEGEGTTGGGDIPTTPKSFAPAGLTLFAIWPYDAVGGNILAIDGVVRAPVLVTSTDSVDINPSSLSAILGYALHYAAFKEGGARWKATLGYYKDFLLAALDQNDRLATSALFRKAMGLDINRGSRPLRQGAELQARQGQQQN